LRIRVSLKAEILGRLFQNFMNLCLSFLVVRYFFPAIDFIEEDLSSSSSEDAFALNLFVEKALVVCGQYFFLKNAYEGKERLEHYIPRTKHGEKVFVIDLNQLLHQIAFFADYTILENHDVIVGMDLIRKIFDFYHSHFSKYIHSYVCPILGF
jgi:hypothetical protein